MKQTQETKETKKCEYSFAGDIQVEAKINVCDPVFSEYQKNEGTTNPLPDSDFSFRNTVEMVPGMYTTQLEICDDKITAIGMILSTKAEKGAVELFREDEKRINERFSLLEKTVNDSGMFGFFGDEPKYFNITEEKPEVTKNFVIGNVLNEIVSVYVHYTKTGKVNAIVAVVNQ